MLLTIDTLDFEGEGNSLDFEGEENSMSKEFGRSTVCKDIIVSIDRERGL